MPARPASKSLARKTAKSAPAPEPIRVVDRDSPDFELAAVVQSMTDAHLQCRDFGHSWRPYTARLIGTGYEQHLRCQRCTTVRKRFLNRHGHVVSSGYDYDDGYIIKGLGRMVGTDKDTLRLASIRKLIVPDTAE